MVRDGVDPSTSALADHGAHPNEEVAARIVHPGVSWLHSLNPTAKRTLKAALPYDCSLVNAGHPWFRALVSMASIASLASPATIRSGLIALATPGPTSVLGVVLGAHDGNRYPYWMPP